MGHSPLDSLTSTDSTTLMDEETMIRLIELIEYAKGKCHLVVCLS